MHASLFFLLHKFLGCVIHIYYLLCSFSFISCAICAMFCSTSFHKHCLLFIMFSLVLLEHYSNGVCHAL
jgi:hypothetical protein